VGLLEGHSVDLATVREFLKYNWIVQIVAEYESCASLGYQKIDHVASPVYRLSCSEDIIGSIAFKE
jgi:hypothetical protein